MLSPLDLDRIAAAIQRGPYEGYPALDQRLLLTSPGLEIADGPVVAVPHGPWHVHGHANRRGVPAHLLDPEVPGDLPSVDAALEQRWRAEGRTLDQYGRPLHPDWRQLLADPRIGMPTGVGFFYRYGPNATVDPVVYRRRRPTAPGGGASGASGPVDPAYLEFLLIKRAKGGQWALPGGFKDRADPSDAHTARREAAEETGLDRIGGTDEVMLRARSTTSRDTLHAWTENTVVLIHGDQEYLHAAEPVPGDDAVDAGWFAPDRFAALDLLGGHALYLDAALARLTGH